MISKLNSVLNINSLPFQRMTVLKQIRLNRTQSSHQTKQLLVDVSAIIREDAHTGIQRVVRALLLQLFSNPPEGYQVLPVFCTRKYSYRYADQIFVQKFCNSCEMPKGDVVVASKDIFLGLDLTAHLLHHHEKQLRIWKYTGVKIHMLVYDMLPHYHPEWFTSKSAKNFKSWLEIIAVYADSMICISETVKHELRKWLVQQGFSKQTPQIGVIPLGAQIKESFPTTGIDLESENVLHKLHSKAFILMVGTIEPRKGYAEALDAMEFLWNNGDETSLVIVGKPGWKTIKLQQRLLTHEQAGKKLFWLSDVSDEVLEKLYIESFGMLMASYGEGFGLPLVESMFYNKKILVRNLQIFNEILEKYHRATFYNTALDAALKNWLQTNEEISQKTYELNPFMWGESSKIMLRILNVA